MLLLYIFSMVLRHNRLIFVFKRFLHQKCNSNKLVTCHAACCLNQNPLTNARDMTSWQDKRKKQTVENTKMIFAFYYVKHESRRLRNSTHPSDGWWIKKGAIEKKQKRKVTMGSRLVSHASTNIAQRCLTSLIGREAVFPPWYEPCILHGALFVNTNLNWTTHFSRVNCALFIALKCYRWVYWW